jgi:hypothetical protein
LATGCFQNRLIFIHHANPALGGVADAGRTPT